MADEVIPAKRFGDTAAHTSGEQKTFNIKFDKSDIAKRYIYIGLLRLFEI